MNKTRNSLLPQARKKVITALNQAVNILRTLDLHLWQIDDASASYNLKPEQSMLYTLAVILIIAWLLGLISDFALGGFIHILLVAAIILILVRLLQGRKI